MVKEFLAAPASSARLLGGRQDARRPAQVDERRHAQALAHRRVQHRVSAAHPCHVGGGGAAGKAGNSMLLTGRKLKSSNSKQVLTVLLVLLRTTTENRLRVNTVLTCFN